MKTKEEMDGQYKRGSPSKRKRLTMATGTCQALEAVCFTVPLIHFSAPLIHLWLTALY